MNVTTDVIRLVWHDKEGVAIEVGPDSDGLDLVRIRTYDAASTEFYGKIDVTFDKDIARALGQALIAAAGEPV